METQRKKDQPRERRGVPTCCKNAMKVVERTERSIAASKHVTKLVGPSKPRF